MNVLFLQGSPRRRGNTETLCARMVETMRAKGAKVKTLRVADMTIKGCSECYTCQKVFDKPGCPIKDDMGAVYDQLLSADLVVLATPVFCWNMSAQLRAVLDRFFALCKFGQVEEGKFKCLPDGKPFALVVTAGGGPYDGAEICVASYRALAEYLRFKDRGEFVAAPVGDPAGVAADKALLARAAEFAARIIS